MAEIDQPLFKGDYVTFNTTFKSRQDGSVVNIQSAEVKFRYRFNNRKWQEAFGNVVLGTSGTATFTGFTAAQIGGAGIPDYGQMDWQFKFTDASANVFYGTIYREDVLRT